MDNKQAFASDLIASCTLPDLTVDLDSTPIESNQFDEYRSLLERQLPLLFDFIHQNDDWVLSDEDNEHSVEIKAKLLMLVCEITAPDTVYRLQSSRFLEVLDNFIGKNFNKILDTNGEVEKCALKLYTKYLKADVWKRHIGPVHGFFQFLKMRVEDARILAINWAEFSLAVGILLRECHLPAYKTMGVAIFQLILSHSDVDKLKDMNIPKVICGELSKGLPTVDTVEDTKAIWNCICECLSLDESVNGSWDWNKIDDMMGHLMSSLKYTSDPDLVACRLSFIPRILITNASNRKEIEEYLSRDFASITQDDFKTFRNECNKNNSCASYRWALYILKLYAAEEVALMRSASVCEKILEQFHITYIICVFIIDPKLINLPLLAFFEEFGTNLMEAVDVHPDGRIKDMIRDILVTFNCHMEKLDLLNDDKGFQRYHITYYRFVRQMYRK